MWLYYSCCKFKFLNDILIVRFPYRNEALRVAYIDEVETTAGKVNKEFFSKLVKGDINGKDKVIYLFIPFFCLRAIDYYYYFFVSPLKLPSPDILLYMCFIKMSIFCFVIYLTQEVYICRKCIL